MSTDTRTIADRVAAVQRGGRPTTEQERYAATALLTDMLAAAAKHGVTLTDFDWVADLPAIAIDAVRAQDHAAA